MLVAIVMEVVGKIERVIISWFEILRRLAEFVMTSVVS